MLLITPIVVIHCAWRYILSEQQWTCISKQNTISSYHPFYLSLTVSSVHIMHAMFCFSHHYTVMWLSLWLLLVNKTNSFSHPLEGGQSSDRWFLSLRISNSLKHQSISARLVIICKQYIQKLYFSIQPESIKLNYQCILIYLPYVTIHLISFQYLKCCELFPSGTGFS